MRRRHRNKSGRTASATASGPSALVLTSASRPSASWHRRRPVGLSPPTHPTQSNEHFLVGLPNAACSNVRLPMRGKDHLTAGGSASYLAAVVVTAAASVAHCIVRAAVSFCMLRCTSGQQRTRRGVHGPLQAVQPSSEHHARKSRGDRGRASARGRSRRTRAAASQPSGGCCPIMPSACRENREHETRNREQGHLAQGARFLRSRSPPKRAAGGLQMQGALCRLFCSQ